MQSSAPDTPSHVDLYWRPGCGFCTSLKRQLDKMGLELTEHNIWDDADAARTVRLHANGHETVPTVVIGDMGLVNPRARDVLAVLDAEAPHLIPAEVVRPEPGKVGGLVGRLLGS